MSLARGLWRMLRLAYVIVWGLAHGTPKHIRALKATPSDPGAQATNQYWCRRVLDCLNVQVSVSGEPARAPCLVVSNHISWLDIMVLASVMPLAFLSKSEISRWPLVSRLAEAGGTLFIKRGEVGAARASIEEMSKAFERRQSVAIFPEGTTSRGEAVQVFHPRLFAAAIESGTPVQPVALRYPHPAGVRSPVPFVDQETLASNIFGLLGCESIQAEAFLGPTIEPGDLDRRQLADRAREFVAGVVEGDPGKPGNAGPESGA